MNKLALKKKKKRKQKCAHKAYGNKKWQHKKKKRTWETCRKKDKPKTKNLKKT